MINNHIVNEETALLAPAKKLQKPTPLPKVQIGIVLLLQLCEPITSQSIYPYINQLISELDITGGDERKVGYYAGLIQSLFYLSETIMVMQWSRISDHIGRKPIILIGLVGVIKSVMGELTDPSNRAQGFSLIPAASAAGATLGPLVGGTFARPREQFPRVFGGQFWQDYPYFLPCLVASSFVCVSFIIGLLFLKETAPKRVIDRGRFPLASGGVTPADAPPVCSHSEVLPLRDLLVRPVVISISNYMALAFLDIMLNALLPLFFAMPIHIGGLGFKPSTIGYIMGLYGLALWRTARFPGGIMLFMPMFLLFPVMSLIARRSGVNFAVKLIIALLLSLMGFMEMAFGCIFIYVMASSPNKHSLGATNGLSQMSVSLIRAVGPALATSLFSLSVEKNVLGGYAVYVVLFCIPCLVIFLAVLLPEKVWEEKDDDDVKPSD
ncbi:major facilitator superfamily domain-containing protein [Infundibulicybe gibba]|nr:major facilitator superfamily domain-containing protein [Infundibulicybe gibba]